MINAKNLEHGDQSYEHGYGCTSVLQLGTCPADKMHYFTMTFKIKPRETVININDGYIC